MTAASVGPGPTAAALGGELRQTLPPALVEALDRIGDQIRVEILALLLSATSAEHLARTFERVFPTFRDYYVSTLLIMWGSLQEDPRRFSALTLRSFQQSEEMIRARGPHWIGQDASLNALQGLATMGRVAKATARFLDRDKLAELRASGPSAELWTNSIVAYAMAFSSVLASLTALEGRAESVRLENVATLAHWTKSYAVRAYHLTKSLGLLQSTAPHAPLGPSEEEDLILAEAGLDRYAEMLSQDDQL